MYETDLDYAAKRLNGTVVRTNSGDLFLVGSTYKNSNHQLAHGGQNLSSGAMEEVLHSDLNLIPIPLGMVNLRAGMAYVSRKPMRRNWRQGLSEHCMAVTYFSEDRPRVPYKLLSQPANNTYPTFRSALTSVKRSSSQLYGKAFSRDFGLEKRGEEVRLIYRKYVVGQVVGDTPVLDHKHQFLAEHLQETIQ